MQFRTTFQIPKSNYKISHQTKILTIGSCFSDEIGEKFYNLKYNSLINPFGVVFNSYSIANIISRSLQKKYYTETDVHQNGEQFFCFDVHSSFNRNSALELLTHLNQKIDEVHERLFTCDVLIITLGTSWVYKRKENDEIISNCHKIASKQFDKILLSTEDNLTYLTTLINELKKVNPNLQVITTVSPVRHTKDGFRENNVSKSRLIDALYQLENNQDNVTYFPSYELMIDDLRDYRFYKNDMIHPSQQAVDYIWNHFSDIYFDEVTLSINNKIYKIQSAIHHRPFNEETDSYQSFLRKTIDMMEELQIKNNISFQEEIYNLRLKIKPC